MVRSAGMPIAVIRRATHDLSEIREGLGEIEMRRRGPHLKRDSHSHNPGAGASWSACAQLCHHAPLARRSTWPGCERLHAARSRDSEACWQHGPRRHPSLDQRLSSHGENWSPGRVLPARLCAPPSVLLFPRPLQHSPVWQSRRSWFRPPTSGVCVTQTKELSGRVVSPCRKGGPPS